MGQGIGEGEIFRLNTLGSMGFPGSSTGPVTMQPIRGSDKGRSLSLFGCFLCISDKES
jgi:hypothetical protein